MKYILFLSFSIFAIHTVIGQISSKQKPFPASEIGHLIRSTNKPHFVDNITEEQVSPDMFTKIEITDKWVWFTYTDENGQKLKIAYYNEADENCIASYDETGALIFIKFQIRNFDDGNISEIIILINDGEVVGLGMFFGDRIVYILE